MPGHIKLGLVGDLRDYVIANLDSYGQMPANQFAAKLATGAGNYDDLQNWSYFVMDDWRAGAGKRDAEAGGFLYAEIESRYPERLQLGYEPQGGAFGILTPGKYSLATTIPVGTTQTVKRISNKVTGINGAPLVWLYLKSDNVLTDSHVTVALYSDSGGEPDTSLSSITVSLSGQPGYNWYLAELSYNCSSGSTYHVVLYPTTSGDILYVPSSNADDYTTDFTTAFLWYNGSTWTADDTLHFYRMIWDVANGTTYNITKTEYLANSTSNHYIAQGADLRTIDNTTVDTFGADITDLLVLGNTLYIGLGDSTNYQTMDTSESTTAASVPARLFAKWGGYLWRAVANSVYYTGDGSTWTGPIEVCDSGWEVLAMAGMEDFMYVTTNDGLYYVGYGDLVRKVTEWRTNSSRILNYQGALHIAIGQQLLKYDGQSMLPMGINLGEGLPEGYNGDVIALVASNNDFYLAVESTAPTHYSSLWTYNGQGWHNMLTLPLGHSITSLVYNRDESKLYIGTSRGIVLSIYAPDTANDIPSSSSSRNRNTSGWLETDWFFGGLMEVYKDCESIYMTGENLDSDHYVKVYWQDDSSTDWELLGTVNADRMELRWSDYATRPNTRQIKLAFLFFSVDATTPQVRAIRLKYHPMVSDWFKWVFPILVSDRQEVPGGDRSPYTRAQMEAHLKSLIKSVQPIIFQDLDGSQYEVNVTGCPIQITGWEYLNDGVKYDAIYNMAIEQIRPESYGN